MTAGDVAQLLTAIAVLGNMALSWRTHTKVTAVEKSTNGMKDALIISTAEAANISGNVQGRKDLLEEQKTIRDR